MGALFQTKLFMLSFLFCENPGKQRRRSDSLLSLLKTGSRSLRKIGSKWCSLFWNTQFFYQKGKTCSAGLASVPIHSCSYILDGCVDLFIVSLNSTLLSSAYHLITLCMARATENSEENSIEQRPFSLLFSFLARAAPRWSIFVSLSPRTNIFGRGLIHTLFFYWSQFLTVLLLQTRLQNLLCGV